MLLEVCRYPLQVLNAGRATGKRQTRGVKLLPDITSAQTQLESAIAEEVHLCGIAREQRGVVETRIQHVGT
jgi:sulfur relay (sulfurtransferase) complex TusBCD TusD component (DsrE family)